MRSNRWVNLELTMDPYDKKKLDFNEAQHFFSKYFRFVNVFFLICWPEFQLRAPLVTDAIYSKLGPTRRCDGFRVELMIFRNYFCLQKFCFPEFCFHLIYFLQPNDLVSPIKDSISFLVGRNEARRFFQWLSNVCYDFQYIGLKKISFFFKFTTKLSYFFQIWAQSQ